MKAGKKPPLKATTASREIDAIIDEEGGWKGKTLSRLRAVIKKADPNVVEEVKWKKPSNPAGVPVWYHDGIVCVANVLKTAVRLTFFEGALMRDPKNIFNTRLDSRTVRAVDFHQDDRLDEAGLKALVLEAVKLNAKAQS